VTSTRSGIRASFDSGDATLAVDGDLDHHSSLVFGALLDIVSSQGYSGLVVELGDMNVLADDVVALIGAVGCRLGEAGGHLTIRSSLAIAGRIRRTVGMGGGLNLEPAATDRPLPGAGGRATAGNPTAAGATPQHLPSRRRAGTAPADVVSLSGALRLLVALAHDTVGGADGVSISLRRHGGFATVASSDQAVVDMDSEQYAAGEGPCVDASTTGHISHAGPLSCEPRWSVFTPRAMELGFNSILSMPLTSHSTPVGALNIYSHVETIFSAQSHDRASALAYHASILLDDAG